MDVKILKFGTCHCAQCKQQDKELLKIKDIPIEKIDAEDNEDLVELYKITRVPTTLIVDSTDGKEILRFGGLVKYEDLMKNLNIFITKED